MALRRRIGNLAQMLLQSHLRDEESKKNSERIGLRQRELAGYNDSLRSAQAEDTRIQDLLKQITGDPTGRIAHSLKRAGRSDIGGMPVDAFMPTPQQILGGMTGDIEKSKTLADLPTPEGAHTRFHTEGFSEHADDEVVPELTKIQELIAARDKALAGSMSPVEVEGAFDPTTGSKSTKFLPGDPRALVGQSVQTSPTTEQGIGIANQEESGTRGEKVRTAGATSGAQARAVNAAETDLLNNPRYQAG